MSVLVWLVVGLVVGLVVCGRRRRQSEPDPLDYQAMVELHRIRRRFDVALLRSEIRADAADARRVLRDALRKLDGEN
ncbi:MAG TPA: hypothetical protein VIH71_16710 [Solirubrobacteraceae bacterium]